MEKAIEIKRRAQRFVQGGDVDAALVEYEKLARAEENEPYHSVVIADLLFKKGDQSGAAHRYLIAVDGYEAAKLYKNGIAVCKKMARLGLAPGQVFKRLGHLHQLDGLATESSLYYLQHAEYALRTGDDKDAAKSFRLAYDSAKENVAALERLAELYLSMGNNEQAASTLREAIEGFERQGQISDANRCRARLAQLGPVGAATAASMAAATPAAADAAPAANEPLKVTRTMNAVRSTDAAVKPAEPARPPRLKVPVKEVATDSGDSATLEITSSKIGSETPANVATPEPSAPQAASASPIANGDADRPDGFEQNGLLAMAEAMAEASAVEDEAKPSEPRSARPGLTFDRPGAVGDDDANGLFFSLAQDAVNVPEIQAMLEEAHEQYRGGAHDQAVQHLVRVAQAYDAASDADSAARVYRTMREYLPPVRPALMLWFDNCRRRDDRTEASRVAQDLGEEALSRGDPGPAREWFERAQMLDPSNQAALARLQSIVPGARSVPASATATARPALKPQAAVQSAQELRVDLAAAPADELHRIQVRHGEGDEVTLELGDLVETFRRGVHEQVSGDAHSHYALGVSYLEMGLVDQAMESLRIAAEEPTLKITVTELIGRCLMDSGRFEDAATEFRNALEQSGVTGESALSLRFELGLALEAAGRVDEALGQFESVYATQPSYPDAAMKIRALRRILEHD